MLGSATDAEDIAQEAFVRYAAVTMRDGEAAVRSPKALLTTITTRLCLDELKSARAHRERYVGPWLPEPVLTAGGARMPLSPLETVEQRGVDLTRLSGAAGAPEPSRASRLRAARGVRLRLRRNRLSAGPDRPDVPPAAPSRE